MKKVLCTLLCALAVTMTLAAQEPEEDDFYLDLNQDFSWAISDDTDDETETAAGSRKKSTVLQGIWIETVSHNNALIHDLATGKKSGYEFDNAHLKSTANWWFWGDITPTFHLDAEISVWNFDKTLYQANSWGASDPRVTWADGLQSLAVMPFSPLYAASDSGVGGLNKMGFTIQTPAVNVKFGYGNLGNNGMSTWTGIYTVLDRWPDVGKGFTEISNGKGWQHIGPFQIDVLAALSMTRGTYGTYDIAQVTWNDTLTAALTFGSYTTKEELFYYNTDNLNAASAYIRYMPTSMLSVEAHGLKTFGTAVETPAQAQAGASRVTLTGTKGLASLAVSYAGSEADTVWGADNAPYDNLHADTLTTTFNSSYQLTDAFELGLDSSYTIHETKDLMKGLRTLSLQLNADADLSPLTDLPLTVGTYGLVNVDQLSYATSKRGRELVPYFTEAGIECIAEDFAGMQKVTLDYAVKAEYGSWKQGHSYPLDMLYHSFMATVAVDSTLSFHAGSILRLSDSMAFAAGFSKQKVHLPGSPMLYVHGTYGMNPYAENQYSLYRADNTLNTPTRRTYLLNDLNSDTNFSQISIGCIWDLQ